jgi:hypothetical protein
LAGLPSCPTIASVSGADGFSFVNPDGRLGKAGGNHWNLQVEKK